MEIIEINVRGDKPYYTQRNNQIRPTIACGTTSMVAALDYVGFTFPKDEVYNQPEDSLLNFILNSKEIDAEYAKVYPYEYRKYLSENKDPKKSTPPNEIHTLLSLGTNLWMGRPKNAITQLKWDLSLQSILFEFIKGRPVVISGVFKKLRHIVCATGFGTLQQDIFSVENSSQIDIDKVTYIIIGDSYGDFRTSYQKHSGKDVKMSLQDFNLNINVQGQPQKWGHLFSKVKG